LYSSPSGNAMLVGVGGSGKQSLARLAAHICGYEVYQIAVSSNYGVADFKEALLGLYTKTGAKVGGVRALIMGPGHKRTHGRVGHQPGDAA
jgi:replication-associated recombination protein RarA